MIYKPKQISKMWDTWLYFHEGTYYLYILITECSPGEGVALATSRDGVHWHEEGLILAKAPDSQWLGTGSVWPSETFASDRRFIMNFSEWRGPAMDIGQQTIFFAESYDLVHWTRLGPEYEFVPDPRWYRVGDGWKTRWDCIYSIPRPGGGRYGYWTANPSAFHPGFGFGETSDGTHWTALEPPVIEWGDTPRMPDLEAGAVEKFGDLYYTMLGLHGGYAGRMAGMYQFAADRPEGPFWPVKRNYELLSSPSHLRMAYFARFFPTSDGVLVNHQVMNRADERYFAPMKRAVVDAEGILRLAYWEGNEALKGAAVPLEVSAPLTDEPASLPYVFDADLGGVLEGRITGLKAGDRRSACLHVETDGDADARLAIHRGCVVNFDLVAHGSRLLSREDSIDRCLPPRPDCAFRLLVRHSLLELYIDDVLVQAYSLPGRWTGKIALAGAEGVAFDRLAAYSMTLTLDE